MEFTCLGMMGPKQSKDKKNPEHQKLFLWATLVSVLWLAAISGWTQKLLRLNYFFDALLSHEALKSHDSKSSR